MVETQGLEPWTPCLQSRCSSQLSYVPEKPMSWPFVGTSEASLVQLSWSTSSHCCETTGVFYLKNLYKTRCSYSKC